MVEWNLAASNKPIQSVRTPDAISGVAHIERIISSSPRPFVLVTERELSVLRRGLTKDGWKRSLYLEPAPKYHGTHVGAGLLSVANRWLDTDISIPDRGGYYHSFFCNCGKRLHIPENLQVQTEYTCPSCGSKYSGPEYDGGVRYLHHNHLAGAVLALALVYGIEKDKAYAEKAAEILLKYVDAYPGPHTGFRSGGIFEQSVDEAVWAIPLAQAYDLIYYSRSLSEEQKLRIEQGLFRPVADGIKAVGTEWIWGSWHLAAVGVIGLAIKDPNMVQYAVDSLRSQFVDQLGDDCLWPGSVHTYHFYPLEAFVHLAEACYRSGIDLYNWEIQPGKSLKTMFLSPLDYAYPCFRLPAINDGWYKAILPLDLYEVAHRRWGDPAFAWVLKKGYRFGEIPINGEQRDNLDKFSRTSFFAFLFGRDLPGRSGTPVLRSRDFPDLGICTLRNDDDVMMTFDYGPYLGDGHCDKLSFTLYANDAVLIPDYGTPGFGAEIIHWYKGTASHNTVLVDGNDQARATKSGLNYRYAGSFVQCAEAEADDCYPGVKHTRKLMLVGNTCLVIDQLTSDDEHNYDWLVHCEGEPEILGDYESGQLDLADYKYIRLDKVLSVDRSFLIDWHGENGDLACGIWNPAGEMQIALAGCPAETAERSASLLVCRQRGKNARFMAAMVPSQSQEEVKLATEGCVMHVTSSAGDDYVYLKGCGDGQSAYGLETDGESAVVRVVDGEIAVVVLSKGSWVKWQDDILLECPSNVDCAELLFEERSPLVKYSGGTAGMVKIRTKARAMRVNGHRAAATCSNGHALLRVTPQMLIGEVTSALS